MYMLNALLATQHYLEILLYPFKILMTLQDMRHLLDLDISKNNVTYIFV